MPIIVTNNSGGVIGAGADLTVQSGLIGPIPNTWVWEFRVIPDGQERPCVISNAIADNDHLQTFIVGVRGSNEFTFPPEFIPQQGDPVHVDVILRDDVGIVQDSGGLTGQIWSDAGIRYPLEVIAAKTGTGLTTEQGEQLQTASVGVVASWMPELAGAAASLISDLFNNPPVKWLCLERHPVDLEGEGELDVPADNGGLRIFGAQWDALAWPAGIGLRPGPVKRFQVRIVQVAALQLIKSGGPGYIVRQVEDANYDGVLWWFQDRPTWRVQYWIAPGVRLQWSWLRMCGPL